MTSREKRDLRASKSNTSPNVAGRVASSITSQPAPPHQTVLQAQQAPLATDMKLALRVAVIIIQAQV